MTAAQQISVHNDPVWRDRANFIVRARLPEPGRAEQLWGRQVDERRFELCCIPFFLYDMALGDVVVTDDAYEVQRVVEPSGRSVFRAWFGDSTLGRPARRGIADELAGLGALFEWSSENLLAVDAENEEHARVVAGALKEHEDRRHLVYETGRTH
jgi:Domain of unknown function (DUF4265)